jgi:hypothetical protein
MNSYNKPFVVVLKVINVKTEKSYFLTFKKIDKYLVHMDMLFMHICAFFQ